MVVSGTVELFMVAGTKIFPDDDGGSDGKSIKEEDRHICDHRCGADGCQCVCPDEVSHYNGVNRIVEHLKDVAHHQGEGKFKKQFGMLPQIISFVIYFKLEPLWNPYAFNVKIQNHSSIISDMST